MWLMKMTSYNVDYIETKRFNSNNNLRRVRLATTIVGYRA